MKDFSNYLKIDEKVLPGRRKKCWLSNNISIGIFKSPKIPGVTKDHVSEYISYLICKKLNIPVAKVELGIYDGEEGSFCHKIDFLTDGIQILNLINQSLDEYNLIDSEGNRYSVDMIIEAISSLNIDIKEFINMILFDFLIGNSDRHATNWGVVFYDYGWHLSPLYDNGSSLCCYEKEENIERLYLGNDKQKINSLIFSKSRTVISINNKKRPKHVDIVLYIMNLYPKETILCVKEIIKTLNRDEIDLIFKDVEIINFISENRIKLIKMFLNGKIDILKQILERSDSFEI